MFCCQLPSAFRGNRQWSSAVAGPPLASRRPHRMTDCYDGLVTSIRPERTASRAIPAPPLRDGTEFQWEASCPHPAADATRGRWDTTLSVVRTYYRPWPAPTPPLRTTTRRSTSGSPRSSPPISTTGGRRRATPPARSSCEALRDAVYGTRLSEQALQDLLESERQFEADETVSADEARERFGTDG